MSLGGQGPAAPSPTWGRLDRSQVPWEVLARTSSPLPSPTPREGAGLGQGHGWELKAGQQAVHCASPANLR